MSGTTLAENPVYAFTPTIQSLGAANTTLGLRLSRRSP